MTTHTRSGWLPVVLATALLLPTAGTAQQSRADSIATACLAADTSSAWREVAAEWSAHAGEPVEDVALHRRLLALRDSDQALRLVPGLPDSLANPDFARRLAGRDSANAAALAAIVAREGWPTRTRVGVDGAEAAFLVAQHNPSIQRDALARMEALPADEVPAADMAMLEDRVRVHAGRPQIYGTQLHATADGAYAVDPVEDLAGLDRRRAEVGLPPFDVYLCVVRGVYGRPVADPRAEAAP